MSLSTPSDTGIIIYDGILDNQPSPNTLTVSGTVPLTPNNITFVRCLGFNDDSVNLYDDSGFIGTLYTFYGTSLTANEMRYFQILQISYEEPDFYLQNPADPSA